MGSSKSDRAVVVFVLMTEEIVVCRRIRGEVTFVSQVVKIEMRASALAALMIVEGGVRVVVTFCHHALHCATVCKQELAIHRLVAVELQALPLLLFSVSSSCHPAS